MSPAPHWPMATSRMKGTKRMMTNDSNDSGKLLFSSSLKGRVIRIVGALAALGLSACAGEAGPIDEAQEATYATESVAPATALNVWLKLVEGSCAGPFYEITAVYGGNATSYQLSINGKVVPTDPGPG